MTILIILAILNPDINNYVYYVTDYLTPIYQTLLLFIYTSHILHYANFSLTFQVQHSAAWSAHPIVRVQCAY